MAQVDFFLKLDGVKGESRDAAHKEELDIQGWSWGESNSGNAQMGGGQGVGKVNVQDLHFTHYIDKASPELWLRCATGTHIKEAVLVCRKAGEKPLEYLKITMTDVLVSSVSTGGNPNDPKISENVSLNFGKFKMEYQEQDGATGAKKGGAITATYNMATNKAG